MPTSSQEPRGSGLSSTLVKDFRAILNALEQEKATRGGDAQLVSSTGASVSGHAGADPRSVDEPARPLVVRREPSERPAPAPYSEVRTRIAALGDVRDMFPVRPKAELQTPVAPLSSEAQPVPDQLRPAALRPVQQPISDSSTTESRRRGFGVVGRCAEGEAPARRRRAASKDAFTWQRLGVLAICMAIAGGGAVALQSVVGREEAKVAPEAIGNAAIASVAPSAPLAMVAATESAEAGPAEPFPIASAPAASTAPSVSAVVAEVPQPTLRNAEPLFETTPVPANIPGMTAFAPTGEADAQNTEALASAQPKAVSLPKQAPLPPPAPVKHVASAEPTAPTDSDTAAVAEEDGPSDTAATGFGGDPVGTITLRSPVTMRAAPKKGAAPIANLPGGQKVDLVACSGWCEVIADGKRGFIYKSFVDVSALKPMETVTP
ncbi:SH3 domain-containing protein [Ancylobacter radicis]|uniref:SH3 domain-containing protein n=1 Tax=Ancylobacter radicis TaxID=2836179 RepID=A0ABS5R1W3_9HYPH|nr:SH3 domain-containing protein [Ancylobacter radicis]MBS9475658.1 SH3 domain-containing protein [Ancylobacter radicis]